MSRLDYLHLNILEEPEHTHKISRFLVFGAVLGSQQNGVEGMETSQILLPLHILRGDEPALTTR